MGKVGGVFLPAVGSWDSLLIPGRWCEWQVERKAGGGASLALTPTREVLCTESGGQPWASAFEGIRHSGGLAGPPCNFEVVLPLPGSSSLSQGNGGNPLEPPGFNYCVLQ